ncbi:hypothetical protein SeMB42_g07976 [Synchytrium endobioticum]|uniref:Uncharacterized protein n=1 Tax=Synchytrium endobioticum TaxID=286115 RepID=A0A507BRC2_9FUNG|nr:hypothetical protein SeMB42_g07976 [Synchytrium endobioticum]
MLIPIGLPTKMIGNQEVELSSKWVLDRLYGIQKKQATIAVSSSEAEYYAIGDATKEILWIQNLLKGIHYPIELPTLLYEDNRGAQLMAENPMVTPRAKHIDIKHHFIREAIKNRHIKLVSISTQDQIADGLTKPLTGPAFSKCCDALGVTTRGGVAV